MIEPHELYWAWALVPLPPRDAVDGAFWLRIRLIAPDGSLRRAAAEFVRIGGTASEAAPASPPLQDTIQVVLTGTLDQFERMVGVAEGPVASALRRTLQGVTAPPSVVTFGKHRFDFATRVYVAGILNNTPDSFYDRGRFYGKDAALTRAEEMVSEGADVIEVGGETAQEGDPLPVREEIARVAPLISELVRRFDRPVAVDTYKPDVAKAAIAAGAVLVNDISGAADPEMVRVLAGSEAGIVIMHLHGRPRQHYTDIDVPSMMDWVAAFLKNRTDEVAATGLPRQRILVDPGLNFGKHPARDLELMRRLPELRNLGFPIFVATSRKDYIRDVLHLHPDDLLEGTMAAVAFAVAQGANMLRVHDVQAMVRVTRMMEFFCGYQSPARVRVSPESKTEVVRRGQEEHRASR